MGTRTETALDPRQEVAEDAAEPVEPPSIFVRAGQFFRGPLVSVAACGGVYGFFQYMVSEPNAPLDLVQEIRSGGAVSRKHASLQLVQVVGEQARRGRLDPA